MRTITNTVVSNGNVFGFGQDCVVSANGTYARAAQHLQSWHASKHALKLRRSLKRYDSVGMAGVAPEARQMCPAITGPQGLLARLTSPALVTA